MTAIVPPLADVAPNLQTRGHSEPLASAQTMALVAGAIGVVASLIGLFTDSAQFYFSYLVAYSFVLTLCLGSMIFVLIQHLTRAGWSVIVRRVAENMMGVILIMPILFIPILIGVETLYAHWWHAGDHPPGHPLYDPILWGKKGYLNPTFFFVRVAIYFAVWIGIAVWFRRTSLRQDETGDATLTLKMSRVAAPCTLLFALSVTFAAVDWIMALDPHWFSTIFGVWFFAGAFMSTMGTMALIFMWLGKKGFLRDAVTTEHYHDLGKLMFAFVVFWSYVSFSQFMLIYYANLPEETRFYANRYSGAWFTIGQSLIVLHFLFPFAFLMSRHMKRGRATLAFGAVLMLVMHFIDLHWAIMPTHHKETVHLSWLDFTTIIGLLGLFLWFFLGNLRRAPLVPERDPRLTESLQFQNH